MTNQISKLEELPNLGKTTLMWLRAIGVRSTDCLAQKGIFWAYTGMRKRGFRVTTAVLFSLEGALRNVPWRSLSAEEKDTLLANLAAYEKQQLPQPRPAGRHGNAPSVVKKRQGDVNSEFS